MLGKEVAFASLLLEQGQEGPGEVVGSSLEVFAKAPGRRSPLGFLVHFAVIIIIVVDGLTSKVHFDIEVGL